MARKRGGEGRGDLLAAGMAWGFNPACYMDDLPLTLLGEIDLGRRNQAGERSTFGATMVEAQYWLWNGVSLRAKADHGLLDLGRGTSLQQRYGLAAEVVPIPGLTLSTWGRAAVAPGGGGLQPDLFVQLHGWW